MAKSAAIIPHLRPLLQQPDLELQKQVVRALKLLMFNSEAKEIINRWEYENDSERFDNVRNIMKKNR